MKHTHILHILAGLGLIGALAIQARAVNPYSDDDSRAPGPSHPASAMAPVVNPVIPSHITLCGQKIDLDKTYNYERFDRELTSLIYTHGNTLLVIKRANRWFPVLAPILKKNGVPEDLLYLAVTESMLNTRAVSGAKAAGIWQFMPSTAREYGLEVSDEVDERFNVEKATAAACRYLKKALSRYGGSWTSVMASYNAGMGRISSQLDAQMADDALELYLNEETSRYPFRVMAYKTIMENPSAYGYHLTPSQLYQPRKVKTYEVSGPVESWAQWSRDHGISYADLREENPWIRAPKLTNKAGKTYTVRVPEAESLSRAKSGRTVYNKRWVR